jgi:hypothetical protein
MPMYNGIMFIPVFLKTSLVQDFKGQYRQHGVLIIFFLSRKTGKYRKYNTYNYEQHKKSWFGEFNALEQEFINTDGFFQ